MWLGAQIVFAGVYLLTKSGKPKDNYEELDKVNTHTHTQWHAPTPCHAHWPATPR